MRTNATVGIDRMAMLSHYLGALFGLHHALFHKSLAFLLLPLPSFRNSRLAVSYLRCHQFQILRNCAFSKLVRFPESTMAAVGSAIAKAAIASIEFEL